MASDGEQTDEDKRALLKQLKTDMRNDSGIGDDLFYFPEHNGVRGYCGTSSIWFVGSKPSKRGGEFPSSATELFYGTLAEYGFHNAHLTDITKERGTVPDHGIAHEEIVRMRPYFRREFELLEPQLVIGMGRRAERGLRYMAITDDVEIGYIRHYSWADRWGREADFIADIESLEKPNQIP